MFNDPFDVPRELAFGIEPDDVVQALVQNLATLVETPPADITPFHPKLQLILKVVRDGATPEVKAKMVAALREHGQSFRPGGESLEAIRATWRSMVPDARILCLTESPSHSAMWLHYAATYRGAVLEFACDDELDSAWLAAKAVEYPTEKPAIYSADGWARLLCRDPARMTEDILHIATFTKSPDWSYESEWRVASSKRPADTGHFTDYAFHVNELIGIYIGPKASDADVRELLLLAKRYPRVKMHSVEIGLSRELVFKPIAA